MAKMINLKPIQTGDACYLLDHHNRDGEALLTVTMYDGCSTMDHAQEVLFEAAHQHGRVPSENFATIGLHWVARWCEQEWQLAQADMPAGTDDDDAPYLDCHILATWEV